MKFIISLALILISLEVKAEPIKIFYENEADKAEIVRSIFVHNYHIPSELFTLSKTIDCSKTSGNKKLDLCLKDNGDLVVVSVDRRFISDTLKIFQAP
jgi:hypothetical protein